MVTDLSLSGIILAAGKGVRMQSSLPKVLHSLAGKTMLEHVVATLQATPLQSLCVVLNEHVAPFADFIAANPDLNICLQRVQNGTGGAVAACAPGFIGVQSPPFAPGELYAGQPLAATHVLICAGDCPALDAEILTGFINDSLEHQAGLAVLGFELAEPTGYGRLICDAGSSRLRRIVEERDASASEKAVRLCNSGVMFAETAFLFNLLTQLKPSNAQAEFYLTDCVALAEKEGRPARLYLTNEWQSFLGVNTPEQLQMVARYMKQHSLS